jgi:hypothetical protein
MKKLIYAVILTLLLSSPCWAAFPTTGILDDFNRANEGPPPSASWNNDGSTGWKVVSNQCVPQDIANNAAAWLPASPFGANQEEYLTLVTVPADTKLFDLYFKTSATNNYYELLITKTVGAGNDIWQVYRDDNAVPTQLGANIIQEISNGDSIGVDYTNGVITVWYKASGGSWTSLGTRAETTYQSGTGYLGFYTSGSAVVDNFGGGAVTSTSRRVMVVN